MSDKEERKRRLRHSKDLVAMAEAVGPSMIMFRQHVLVLSRVENEDLGSLEKRIKNIKMSIEGFGVHLGPEVRSLSTALLDGSLVGMRPRVIRRAEGYLLIEKGGEIGSYQSMMDWT